MQNLKRLKPTTIFALDPYAAALCEEVLTSLKRDFGARGRLIQAHALAREGDALRFEQNLSSVADRSFDLEAARNEANRDGTEEAKALFEREASKLQSELIRIFEEGRSADEIEKAGQEGIEIARERMIYLMLSAAETSATAVMFELTHLIRWLFATKFEQDIHTLQIIVLLPGLFARSEQPDYATAYAFFKRLDHGAGTGLSVLGQKNIPLFDDCWLVDGTNARGDKIGTLTEKLESYGDALAGFLLSEPERSGPPPGTMRGKPSVYSSFGHGELYYPAEIVVQRLSCALARDIIKTAFLGSVEEHQDNGRKLLLAAKQYVLGTEYTGIINGLDRDQGGLIWQPFDPRVEIEREGAAREFVSELQRRHEEFERKSLPGFQQALLTRSKQVRHELVLQLDAEIDRQADTTPNGLREAREMLGMLVDPNVALQTDTFGERPQNFTTELREAKALLDRQHEVTVDHGRTKALLEQVGRARKRLKELETSLLLIGSQPTDNLDGPGTPVRPQAKSESGDDSIVEEPARSSPRTPQEERQQLIDQIELARQEIQDASVEYKQALKDEDHLAQQMRTDARQRVREAKAKAVADAEQQVRTLSDQLGQAKQTLAELAEERRDFIRRNFIIYPSIAAFFLFVVPGLGALLGFGPAVALANFFWEHLSSFTLGIVVAAILYLSLVLYMFLSGINRRFKEAREQVSNLAQNLKYAALQLRGARNDQLRLEYDIYAQDRHVDTLMELIKTAQRRMAELGDTLRMLDESYAEFARQHGEAIPPSSMMRRSVLSAAAIDAYYVKAVTHIEQEAGIFVKESVSRSQVRRMTMEEFKLNLETFARQKFDRLSHLSIERVLLQESDLIPESQAILQLRELDGAAEPLLRLREIEVGDDHVAQRDVTLWAGSEDRDQLLTIYQNINPKISIRSSEEDQKLRALTRILNFPIYLLSQIEFYRACHERVGKESDGATDSIPDVLPVSGEVRRVYEQLLLAIAMGIVLKDSDGEYILADGRGNRLGDNRRQIAEKFATDYSSRKIYDELTAQLQPRLSDQLAVHQSITDLQKSAPDLESYEHETLSALAKEYDPSRLI